MGPQPMGKVPDLRRLAGRVASRSTVRWSWLWTFLGFCLLAAVVGGPTVGLPHAQVAAAVAELPRSARGPASLPQAITFDQPPDTTVGQQVTLAASSVTTTPPPVGTGLTVSFRSDTPAMCTVSGSIATPTAPGFCVITATQGGDGTYAPAPDVARAFRARAGPEPQTITFDQPAAAAVGQPVALTAASVTMTSPPVQTGLTVSFRSDTPDVCTVSGSAVTPTTADVCTITASQGGSDRYAAARPVQRSFQAHTGTSQQTITFALPPDVILGQPVTLSASTDADEPLAVSFRSDSPMVCTVSGSTVTTVAVGPCAVTAFQGGSATYAAARASTLFQVIVTIYRSAQQILFGPVPGATVGVPVVLTASSRTLVVEGPDSPTGLAVSYSSKNRRVCTVSGATVVPWTAGRCMITAFQDGTAQYGPAEPVTQVFPVARASQTISFTPPASATIGQPVTLTATASSWLLVTYTSSTPDVCTVSGATVAAAAAGACIIMASQPGDGQYAPADRVTGSFPVQKIPQTISFTPPNGAEAGQRVAMSASATSKLGVSFTSDTPGVCTVSGTTATTIKAGTCTITASQAGNDRYAAAGPVRKAFSVARIPQTIDFPQPPGAAFGQPVTLTAKASSGLPVTYSTSTPGVCTVSGRTVTTTAARACAITASQAGNARYAAARDVARSFRVERAAQTITFTPPDGTAIGQPVTLSASASSGAGRVLPLGHPGGVHGLRLHRLPGCGRHLHHHRLPAWQRQLRGSARGIPVLPGPQRHRPPQEGLASDHLWAAAGRGRRPAGHFGRVCHLRARGVVPLGHTLGVQGLGRHRHRDRGRHLRHHRLPGRRRPLRGRPRRAAILRDRRQPGPRQEGLAGDHFQTAAGRGRWPGDPPVRQHNLRARGVVPLGHPGGVLGLRRHRHYHDGRHLRRHRIPGRQRTLPDRP